ncbi:MAG: TIM44-like domain-containing protein [Candidatus Dormibacteraeota bacterium]|nr:TIM44-like domain-containing protein [Candidatus Dormibacteraeota bacterium]
MSRNDARAVRRRRSVIERAAELRRAATAVGLALLFSVMLPAVALARGGGGSHGGAGEGGFGGGGGGGVGGGGFGGGGGYYPVGDGGGGGSIWFLIPVVIILIVFYLGRHAARQRSYNPSPGRPYQPYRMSAVAAAPRPGPDPAVLSGLEAIAAADPDFEAESFLQRSEMVLFLVKQAYQERNVHQGRAFLANPLYETWKAEVDKLQSTTEHWLFENLNVRSMHVVAAERGPEEEWITVHFDLVSDNKLIDDETGRALRDSGEDIRYGERWTFTRAAGARTVQSGGVVAQKCPNCGALLDLHEDGTCNYCGVDVPSGKYDWTVSRIENAGFSGIQAADSLGLQKLSPEEGLALLKGADPAFDYQDFERRAAQAFMSLQQAWQARDLDSARPFMSPGLYFSWSAQVKQLVELHKINRLDGLRIDAMQPVRVIHGKAFDDLTVRITATCADYEVDERSGRIIFGSRTPSTFSEYWTFQRSVDAKTTGKHAVDKVCPNCGAPLQINEIGECQFCHAAVTSGRFDWVLSRIEQEDEWVQ